MKKITQIFLGVSIGLAFAGNVLADGTHGVKFTFDNQLNAKVQVKSYNGKDGATMIPHKIYYIDGKGSRTIKCHGEGKNGCHIRVSHTGAVFSGAAGFVEKFVKNSENCILSVKDKVNDLSCS